MTLVEAQVLGICQKMVLNFSKAYPFMSLELLSPFERMFR